jgi:hypothetical protein
MEIRVRTSSLLVQVGRGLMVVTKMSMYSSINGFVQRRPGRAAEQLRRAANVDQRGLLAVKLRHVAQQLDLVFVQGRDLRRRLRPRPAAHGS